MLADELVVLDADSHLWRAARPLLDAALRLDQHNDTYSWHGWDKQQMNRFLKNLPRSAQSMRNIELSRVSQKIILTRTPPHGV